ncbi:MAG: class I SAM-dependent methyltransferase [Methanomassiliicoccus sp.]|nr:class I SAM-dependent methyltransferase [Methanomassiliicoccus sp.]
MSGPLDPRNSSEQMDRTGAREPDRSYLPGSIPCQEEGELRHLEAIRDYWTMRADGYSRSILDDLGSEDWGRWMGVIKRHATSEGALEVLDIGTGPGFFPILMGREGHRITAVDYTEAMLDMARKNCQEFGVTATFRRMDAQDLAFPDNTFDLILSRNLVWDLEKPRQAYREWLRVLRPGGRMIVFDGNHYLHLYDQAYALEEGMRKGGDHRYLDGVDTNIIKEIARDLPLSRERRPQWDMSALVELGARLVLVDMQGMDPFQQSIDGEAISLPRSFIVVAEK